MNENDPYELEKDRARLTDEVASLDAEVKKLEDRLMKLKAQRWASQKILEGIPDKIG